jgi:hypothetical protein
VVATTVTDDFGDFLFDGLVADGSEYTIEINAGTQSPMSKRVVFNRSCSIGTLRLAPEDERQNGAGV